MADKKVKTKVGSVSQNHLDDDALYSKFSEFVNDSSNDPKKLNPGDVVEGIVVDKRSNYLIVDVGYKSEGIVAGREMRSETVDVEKLKVGDKVMVSVVKPEDEDGQLVLSIRRTDMISRWLALQEAQKNNELVEVVVTESNNGGVICDLGGNIFGFIPTSQLDSSRIFVDGIRHVGRDISSEVQKKLAALVGEKIKARIIELDIERNKIILSEKARDAKKKEETLKRVKEGDVLHGEVSGITNYGIFVNAEGLEGLVHLSELSWDKVDNIDKLYKVGDKVDVMIIGVDDGGKRVAYSIKRLQKDPWTEAIAKYKVGDIVKGTVQKVVDYGAFVRIGDGLNGLVHISEISDRLVKDPRDYVKEGDTVEVKILSISSTERHLGLSLKWKNQGDSEKTPPVKKVKKEDLDKALEEVLEEN